MKFNTKFNLGDLVYYVYSFSKSITFYCPTCNGEGQITVKEKQYTCPECYGHKTKTNQESQKFQIAGAGKIGRIEIIQYSERYLNENGNCNYIRYMLDSTGVGSGTCHNESCLFSTQEEAQAACNVLNKNEIKA